MITQLDGYKLKCEACGAVRTSVHFNLGMQYLWANQYGTKIRLSCHMCGAVHDVTIKHHLQEVVIEQHSMKCAIFTSPLRD